MFAVLRLSRPAAAAMLRGASFSTSSAAAAKVGFIGLGNMGKPMCSNLIKAGHSVTIFDVATAPVEELKAQGATVAATPAAAAANVEAVVTMLPSSPHVREVYENGVFTTAKPGTLFIDCSTIDPTVTRKLAATATSKKFRMVDAPVSGGVIGAAAGTLTFMVGGEVADFEASMPLLQHMGKNIVHCGAAGTGQIAKLCNNLILGISMTAVSEAMNLGVKLGADAKTLAAIINTSSGRCWSSELYNPVPGVLPNTPASRGYTGGFGAALMAKDLGLALDAAKVAGVSLPTGASAHALYQILLSHGMGNKDFSAVYAFLQGSRLDK